MKVLKFGGTSVGSVNSMLSVKKIVEAIDDKVIVVVSALGGITDKLIKTSQMASEGDSAYEREMKEIVNRHIEMVYTVIPAGYFPYQRFVSKDFGYHCKLWRTFVIHNSCHSD